MPAMELCRFLLSELGLAGLLGEDRRRYQAWEGCAQRIGLVVVRSGESGAARGTMAGHSLDVEWKGAELAVALRGPQLVDPGKALQVHTRLAAMLALGRGRSAGDDPRLQGAAESDALARALLQGVAELARSGDAVLVVRVTARSHEEALFLWGAAHATTWVADEVGWKAPPRLEGALQDPDPRVQLRAWEQLLGGWAPTGFHSTDKHPLAQKAARSPDPLVATLGALHLGAEGLPALKATVLSRASTDEVVGRALRGVWDELTAAELGSLLDRSGEEVIVRACRGLARVGRSTELPALRRWSAVPDARGEAAKAAVATLLERVGAVPGGLAIVTETGGLSVARDPGGLAISPEGEGE